MNDEPSDILNKTPIKSGQLVHIGAIIQERLRQEGRSIGWFAKEMNCDRSNMYKMLGRAHLDSNFILRASKILEHDFFKDISSLLEENLDSSDWSELAVP